MIIFIGIVASPDVSVEAFPPMPQKGKGLQEKQPSSQHSANGSFASADHNIIDSEMAQPHLPPAIVENPEMKIPAALSDLVSSLQSTKEKCILLYVDNLTFLARDRAFVNSMVDLSFLNLPDAADSAK